MDVHSLDVSLRQYYSAALSDSTKKTYQAAASRYFAFCESFGLPPFPTSESILCYFTTLLGQQGIAYSSIKTYLSGVRQAQLAAGFGELKQEAMPRLLRGVQVLQGRRGQHPRARLPITPSILRRMHPIWQDDSSHDKAMLWAAATLTFFSFCHSGVPSESSYDPQVHLSICDIKGNDSKDPSVISIFLKRTKTDQVGKGVKVYIGRTNDDLCPITALMRYLRFRGSCQGPLFQFVRNSPEKFVEEVKVALTSAGIDASRFSGHSFRIGVASTAAAAGLEDSLIQTLGRWKSDAYLLYVRIPPTSPAAVSISLAQCPVL